jgi:hypothetical protein
MTSKRVSLAVGGSSSEDDSSEDPEEDPEEVELEADE